MQTCREGGGWPTFASSIRTEAAPALLILQSCAPRTLPSCSLVTGKPRVPCYSLRVPNKLRRYYGAGYLHFITTSCYRRLPLLGKREYRDLLLEVLESVRRRYHFVVVGGLAHLCQHHKN